MAHHDDQVVTIDGRFRVNVSEGISGKRCGEKIGRKLRSSRKEARGKEDEE